MRCDAPDATTSTMLCCRDRGGSNVSEVQQRFGELVLNARLSRRAVAQRAAALGVSGVALSALLAACGGSSTPKPAATTGSGSSSGSSATSSSSTTSSTSDQLAAHRKPAVPSYLALGKTRTLWTPTPRDSLRPAASSFKFMMRSSGRIPRTRNSIRVWPRNGRCRRMVHSTPSTSAGCQISQRRRVHVGFSEVQLRSYCRPGN